MSAAWHREAEWLDRVGRWVALHPVSGTASALEVATEVHAELRALGFAVEELRRPGHAPLLVARRPAPIGIPTIGLYGHYDIEPVHESWHGDALQLRVAAGRAYGRGIADNLGPLAQRLLAARDVRSWPGVLWVIEGEEETGSPVLAGHLAALRAIDVAVWLDETGYFEVPERQRILAFRSDERLDALCRRWRELSREESVSVVLEARPLNRASATSAGSVGSLFGERPYAAFGPNDAHSNVHGADESLPLGTLALTARQLVATLEHMASGGQS
ncbi:M20/M25/M40 family metallo-hydrolase [Sorangium sp. So ce145]|uniref:M20/M25/M40 family metallo-hydrolase n=1 Tax=Sorangium sp. So ce145 TaxID=3133285 RepID=UPI003F61427B